MAQADAAHYRPDIDGLRAIAVLGVVLYHALPGWARGGYVGVDVFFVISGFLISGIVLRERDAGSFSLLTFYARRVRRLFPALAAMLIGTGLIGWFYLLPDEFAALGKHTLAGAGYALNFVLRQESGYFDAAAETKPLLHLWSLGVEEQFYIVWPLILMFVRSRRTLLLVIAGIVLASFGASLYSLTKNNVSAFYLPHYRMWELGAGALLAAVALYRPDALRLSPRLADAISVCGFALIAAAIAFMATPRSYPGFYGLIPVSGTVLLIAAGPQAVVNRLILAHPIAVFIGLISYPLYLWHWPLLSFAQILGVKSDPVVVATIIAASFALAIATYYWVERPIRHLRGPSVPAGLVTATALIGLVGATAYAAWLQPRLNAFAYQDIADAKNDWDFPNGLAPEKSKTMKLYHAGSGSNAVLYLGDSNVEQYWPRVQRLLELQQSKRAVIFATHGGCAPIPGLRLADRPDCDRYTTDVVKFADDPRVSTVVIAAAWLGYFDNPLYQVGDTGTTVRGTPGWDESFNRLEQFIGRFTRAGKSVWVVLGIPYGGTLGPAETVQRELSGEVRLAHMSVNRNPVWEVVQARLRQAAEAAGARAIDPFLTLCERDACPGRTASGAIMYKDHNHLRASYVREHGTFIDPTLEDVATGALGR